MNILIITFGSHGDVQPYVGLGKGLEKVGHKVTICTASRFESFIEDNGLSYAYMTDEFLKLLDSDIGREVIIEHASGLFGVIRSLPKLMKYIKPITKKMVMDSWEAAKSTNPDLIIYHPKTLGAVSIAEKMGIPVIMANLQPMIVPTVEFPMLGMPAFGLGPWYNKLTYRVIDQSLKMYDKVLNDFRNNTLNLSSFPKSLGMLFNADAKPIPILHGFSSHIIARPFDWPDSATVNGYWFLNKSDDWKPSDELKNFIDAGEPPVYIGFGSMAGRNPKRLADIAIKALAKSNSRAILATGWGGLEACDLPENIFKIEKAPHDWLFPRMSAIVHHGGTGTTAAALKAGKPMTICPFIADQPFWGHRIYSLGAATKPIPQKRLSVDKLSRALNEMLNNQTMQSKAKELSIQILNEHGIENTVSIIENIYRKQTTS